MGEMPAQPDSSYRPQPEPNRGRLGRWQFSLGGLLLFVLFVAMGLSLFVAVRRAWQAEAELADYQRQYGILKVEDLTELQAVAVWTGEPNHWRWRVYFPRGRYDICYATEGIPANGLPSRISGCNADFEGLCEISVAAYRDPKDGVWKYALSSHGPHVGVTLYPTMAISPPEEGASEENGTLDRDHSPTIAAPDEPFVLLRKRAVRAGKNGVSSMNSTSAYDGLAVWIRRTGPWRGDNSTRAWSADMEDKKQ
jgi:hypothetical protein